MKVCDKCRRPLEEVKAKKTTWRFYTLKISHWGVLNDYARLCPKCVDLVAEFIGIKRHELLDDKEDGE